MAVIAVPIAKRLGRGSVLGYRIAGIAIGPVTEGSHAASNGLREGDVLFQVNRVRVKTLRQLSEAAEDGIRQIKMRRGERLVTLVSR